MTMTFRLTPFLVLFVGCAALLGAQSSEKKIDRAAERIAEKVERASRAAEKAAERAADRVSKRLEDLDDDDVDDDDDASDRNVVHRGSHQQATTLDTTFAFPRDGVVDLSSTSGEIVVTGWTRGEAKIHASSERGRIRWNLSPSRITIETESVRGRVGETRYELSVPKGVRVIMRSSSGDLSSHGTGGAVDVSTTSGDIEVQDANGRVTIESVSGEVTGSALEGEVEVNSVSGDVQLDDVKGSVRVETTSGEIVLQNVRSSNVTLSTVNGEVQYGGSIDNNGRYEFHSHSGDVTLEIPASASAHFSVETFSGELDSDFPVTIQPGERSSRRPRRLEFNVGSGEARVIAESFSGDVNVRRR